MSKYDFELDMETENGLSCIARQIEKNKSVLEFGPAVGRLTRYLKGMLNCTVDIVEIDPSGYEKAIKFARDGVLGDIESFEWEKTFVGRTYDYIIFADVLEHLRNPQRVIEVCKKFLKEDGKIVTSIPNVAHDTIIYNLLQNKFQYNPVGLLDDTHIHLFTYYSAKEMFVKAGMKLVLESGIYVGEVFNEFPHSLSKADGLSRAVLLEHPFGEVYQFVFTAMKAETVEKQGIEPNVLIKKYADSKYGRIYWPVNGEYKEENRLLHEIGAGKFQFKVCKGTQKANNAGLVIPEEVKEFRFDPVEGLLVTILDLKIFDGNNNLVSYKCNDAIQRENMTLFLTDDPQIVIDMDGISEVTVEGKIGYIGCENTEQFSRSIREVLQEKQIRTDEIANQLHLVTDEMERRLLELTHRQKLINQLINEKADLENKNKLQQEELDRRLIELEHRQEVINKLQQDNNEKQRNLEIYKNTISHLNEENELKSQELKQSQKVINEQDTELQKLRKWSVRYHMKRLFQKK